MIISAPSTSLYLYVRSGTAPVLEHTLSELREIVRAMLRDTAYSASTIDRLLNQCVNELSSMFQLPKLKTSGTLTTSTTLPYVTLPTDYQKDVYQVYCGTEDRLAVISKSWADFVSRYSDDNMLQAGNVYEVCVAGPRLYYQYIPASADTLTIYYYRMPTAMASDGDVPDGVPDTLQEILLTNYAAREIDKIRALPEKAALWDSEYNSGLAMLKNHVGPEDYTATDIADEWDYAE